MRKVFAFYFGFGSGGRGLVGGGPGRGGMEGMVEDFGMIDVKAGRGK